MKKLCLRHVLSLVCVTLMLGACAERSMMSSFQDITSDSQRLGFFMSNDKQFSGLSLTGFIASPAPGFMYAHSHKRGPLAAVGIAGGKESYIVSKTVESTVDAATFSSIKTTMEDIKYLSLRAVQLRMSESLKDLEQMKGEIDKTLAESIKELFEPLKEKVEDSLDTEPVKQLRSDTESDLAKAQEKNEEERKLLKADIDALSKAHTTDVSTVKTVFETLHPDAKKTEETKELLEKLPSTDETSDSVEAKLAVKEKELAGLINTSGILIFRWTAEDVSNSSLNLAGIMGGGNQKDKTLSGYAIVAGLRLATLFVGTDVHNMWPTAVHKPEITSKPLVTTMVAQARRIAYISEVDLQELLAMKAKIDVEKLGQIAANWQTMLKLTLAASMARVAQLSNTGVISDMQVSVHPLVNLNPSGRMLGSTKDAVGDRFMLTPRGESLPEEAKAKLSAYIDTSPPFLLDKWTTFYHVSTDLKTLRSLVKTDAELGWN